MLACACAFPDSLTVSLAGMFGGWAAFWVLQPCYRPSVLERPWGIPRFGTLDFVPLTLLMLWPLLFGRIGLESRSFGHVATCVTLYSLCMAFLWFRGLWLLERLGVEGFFKRMLFLAAVLPAAVLLSFAMGLAIIVSVFIGPMLPISSEALLGTWLLAGVNWLLFRLVRAGIAWILGAAPLAEAGADEPALFPEGSPSVPQSSPA